MAAFACLAEYPGRLQNVFENIEASKRGKYTVTLYNNGKPESVVIDDFIPCSNEKPKFAKPHGCEMWVMLLEKAVAKFCGGYHNLDGGLTGWGIHVLTGDPCFFLEREPGPGNKWRRKNFRTEGDSGKRKCFVVRTEEVYDAAKVFDILFEYRKKEAIMAAANDGGGGDSADNARNGICQGHAYSVLDVRVVAGFKLVRCRNPWGTFEWTGKWSDKSDMWQQNPKVKDQLTGGTGEVDKDDGAFWMDFDDFSTNFSGIDIIDRSTGERDLALRIDEEQGCFGPCCGCAIGCCQFWFCCKGCGILCCSRKADGVTRKGKRGFCDNERMCC